MTLEELYRMLQELYENTEEPESVDVILVTQQNYPLRSHILGVSTDVDLANAQLEDPIIDQGQEIKEVYIIESGQDREHPYTSSDLWNIAQTA